MRKIAILAAAALLVPAVSQAKTLEDILVEKGVITRSEAQSAQAGNGTVSYTNDGTRFDFPSKGFTTGFQVFAQESYAFTDNDEDAGRKNTSSFDVEKARLAISGTALHEEFSYMLNADFVGDQDEGGTESDANLKDAFLTWHACDNGWIRIGQFKTGFTRQINNIVNSSGRQQFATNSVTTGYFDLGRQQGAASEWNFMEGRIVMGAGIYNGSSDGEGINSSGLDTHHTGIATIRADVMGKMDPFSEGDIDWTQDMAINVGAAYAYADNNSGAANIDSNSVSVNANLKYVGFALHGEYFVRDDEPQSGDSVNPSGFYVQGGYFIDPKTVELAASYAYLDCDDGLASGICSGNDNINEAKFGVNYYWTESHNLKVQLNYVFQNEDIAGANGDDVNTNKWVVQFTQYI